MLEEFRDSQGGGDGDPGIVRGDSAGEDVEETHQDRAAALKRENWELREAVEAQAAELETLRQRVADLEEQGQQPGEGEADAVDGGQEQPEDWRPPRRRHGLPDAGVVTLEEQPD